MTKKIIETELEMGYCFLTCMLGEEISLSDFKKEIDNLYASQSSPENVFFEIVRTYYGFECKWTHKRLETDDEYEDRLLNGKNRRIMEIEATMKQLEQELTELKGETN